MIRSGYSFRRAFGHLNDVHARVLACGYPAAPLTDTCTTFGFVKWNKLCKKADVKPVFGVEIGVTADTSEKKPAIDYWTFLARDNVKTVNELIKKATMSSTKEPTLTYAEAMAAEGVFKIVGHSAQLELITPQPDLFIGLSPAVSKGFFNAAKAGGHQFLARSENFYPTEDQQELYRVALFLRASTQTYPQHILTDIEWSQELRWIADEQERGDAIANRDSVLKLCNAELKHATLLKPERPATLLEMCEAGAVKMGCDLTDPVYRARLEKELKLIDEKEFSDYFYILADMINWAKERMIVGPARGSSCGSLVCYLLGITAIDPIPYGLIFERFIDINRKDLPDIDVDFSDVRRDMVFEYAEQKYGSEHVARLGTVGLFKPTSALNQVGASLQIPKWMVARTLEGVTERSSGDSRAMLALEDAMAETEAGRSLLREFPEAKLAARMEGHPNNASQHAAGVVITQDPITDYIGLDSRTNSAMCDKKDAEDLNLLKIDALGLTQLSIFERTLQLIGKPDVTGYLETLPLNDQKAFDVLNEGRYSGIFQFTGQALKSLTKQIKIDKLDDMVSITALARPGPMATGGANSWVKRRTGREEVTTVHPMLTELTKDTYGIVIYQETVMNVVRAMGNFSWEDTSAIRKAMSGRLGNEFFERYWLKFAAGAKENDVNEVDAKKVWDQICTMGSWAFNKCLAGDTKIKIANTGSNLSGEMTIAQLYKKYESHPSAWIKQRKSKPWLLSLFPDGRGRPQAATRIMKSGKKICWKYNFSDGSHVTCTPEHKFIVNGDWLPIGEAQINDEFSSMRYEEQFNPGNGRGKDHAKGKKYKIKRSGFAKGVDNPAWVAGATAAVDAFKEKMHLKPCQDCEKQKSRMEVHHNDFNSGKDNPEGLTWLCAGCHKKRHYLAGRKRRWEKGYELTSKVLVSKKNIGLKMTYDIEMPEHHNFTLSNGLVTHNSHAVAYGIVSYWCCWLKAYHPMEFAAATLDAESDPMKQIAMLRELNAEGIDYVPFDIEHSTGRWEFKKEGHNQHNLLTGPLSNVKGIGPKALDEILQCRRSGQPIRAALMKKLVNGKTPIDTLWPIRDAVLRKFPDLSDPNGANIRTKPMSLIDVQCGIKGDVVVIVVMKKIAPKDENEPVNVLKRIQRAAQRGQKTDGILTGPLAALNLFVNDDTDEIFAKVNRFNFEAMGRQIIERGKPGKAIYAIKGDVPADFRMINIKQIRYLCDIDDLSPADDGRRNYAATETVDP